MFKLKRLLNVYRGARVFALKSGCSSFLSNIFRVILETFKVFLLHDLLCDTQHMKIVKDGLKLE